ncbi:hypothetical protein [Paenibacillus sp. YYML68]|uniref:hypothetical protein n=1 Tax=Paenibacillus sp. YYML68 TaxID=2909250 RepID=UPI00248F7AD0|nr:hypothetical protein [Paenibacillus sp. YYML68]
MTGWLNLMSLIFGLIAWLVPIVYLLRTEKQADRNRMTSWAISMSSCAISLLLQLFHFYFMVKNEDFGAMIDTNGVVQFAATVLVVGTILLNAVNRTQHRSES